MIEDGEEIPLLGGDVTEGLVRVGDTVRRPPGERARTLELTIGLNVRAWHTMKYRAETLGGGWQRMWSEGVGDKIRARQTWLEENADSLTTALLS